MDGVLKFKFGLEPVARLPSLLRSNLSLIEELEFHDLRFEGIRVQEDDFAGIPKAWHCDEPDFLTDGTFDDRSLVSWLIPNEINMR